MKDGLFGYKTPSFAALRAVLTGSIDGLYHP